MNRFSIFISSNTVLKADFQENKLFTRITFLSYIRHSHRKTIQMSHVLSIDIIFPIDVDQLQSSGVRDIELIFMHAQTLYIASFGKIDSETFVPSGYGIEPASDIFIMVSDKHVFFIFHDIRLVHKLINPVNEAVRRICGIVRILYSIQEFLSVKLFISLMHQNFDIYIGSINILFNCEIEYLLWVCCGIMQYLVYDRDAAFYYHSHVIGKNTPD